MRTHRAHRPYLQPSAPTRFLFLPCISYCVFGCTTPSASSMYAEWCVCSLEPWFKNHQDDYVQADLRTYIRVVLAIQTSNFKPRITKGERVNVALTQATTCFDARDRLCVALSICCKYCCSAVVRNPLFLPAKHWLSVPSSPCCTGYVYTYVSYQVRVRPFSNCFRVTYLTR